MERILAHDPSRRQAIFENSQQENSIVREFIALSTCILNEAMNSNLESKENVGLPKTTLLVNPNTQLNPFLKQSHVTSINSKSVFKPAIAVNSNGISPSIILETKTKLTFTESIKENILKKVFELQTAILKRFTILSKQSDTTNPMNHVQVQLNLIVLQGILHFQQKFISKH